MKEKVSFNSLTDSVRVRHEGDGITECKRILGTFTILEGRQCPAHGIIIIDSDTNEVLDLLVDVHKSDGSSELKWIELEQGAEFRFETLDTIFVDEWAWNPTDRLGDAGQLRLVETAD